MTILVMEVCVLLWLQQTVFNHYKIDFNKLWPIVNNSGKFEGITFKIHRELEQYSAEVSVRGNPEFSNITKLAVPAREILATPMHITSTLGIY